MYLEREYKLILNSGNGCRMQESTLSAAGDANVPSMYWTYLAMSVGKRNSELQRDYQLSSRWAIIADPLTEGMED